MNAPDGELGEDSAYYAKERARWRSLKSAPSPLNPESEDARLQAYLTRSASRHNRLSRARQQVEQEVAEEDGLEDAPATDELLTKFRQAVMIDSGTLGHPLVEELQTLLGLIRTHGDAKKFANQYSSKFSDLGQLQLRTAIMGQQGWHRNLAMMRSLSKTLSAETRARSRMDSGSSPSRSSSVSSDPGSDCSSAAQSIASGVPPMSPTASTNFDSSEGAESGQSRSTPGTDSANVGVSSSDSARSRSKPTRDGTGCMRGEGFRDTDSAKRSNYANGIVAPRARHARPGYHDDTAVSAVAKLATTPRTRRSRRSLEEEARQMAEQTARAEAAMRLKRTREMQEWQKRQRDQAAAAAAAAGSGDVQSTRRPSTAPLAPVEYTNSEVPNQSPRYERGVAAVLVPGRRDLGAKRDRAKVYDKPPLHALSEAPLTRATMGTSLPPGMALPPPIPKPPPSEPPEWAPAIERRLQGGRGSQSERTAVAASLERREVWLPRPATRGALTSRGRSGTQAVSTATLAASVQHQTNSARMWPTIPTSGSQKRPCTSQVDSARKRQHIMRPQTNDTGGGGAFHDRLSSSTSSVVRNGHPIRRNDSALAHLPPPSMPAVATAAGGPTGWPARHPFENAAAAANQICFGSRQSQADLKQNLRTDRATAGTMTMGAPLQVGSAANRHETFLSPARELRQPQSKTQATIAGFGAARVGMLHRGPPPVPGFSKMQAGEVAEAINGVLQQRGQR
eukprot:COSAG02_NODE_395_length_23127_cov_130.205663_6_plen_736_part_00